MSTHQRDVMPPIGWPLFYLLVPPLLFGFALAWSASRIQVWLEAR